MEPPNDAASPDYTVAIHPACAAELDELGARDPRERIAMIRARRLLELAGPRLGHPDSSAIRAARGLRELRPRRGRSRHRLLYAPTEAGFVLLALAPEARHSPHHFRAAVARAQRRLDDGGPRDHA